MMATVLPRVLPWSQAWQQALYGEHGFYRRPEGPAGHFSTSVVGVPHASTVMAQAITALARRHDLGTVVDLGSGRGELIAAIAAQAPDLRCVGIDVVPRPTHLDPRIHWCIATGGEHIPASALSDTHALVVAHEWLDVVPTVVARHDPDGRWRSVYVDTSTGQQHQGDLLSRTEQAWVDRWVEPVAHVCEIGLSRERALADVRAHVRNSLVLVIDYCHRRGERPLAGSLAGYRAGSLLPPVPDGSMDVTAHVAIDALEDSLSSGLVSSCTQTEALADLLGHPPTPTQDLARQAPAAYVQALATQGAHRALRQPGALGDFCWVLAASTG